MRNAQCRRRLTRLLLVLALGISPHPADAAAGDSPDTTAVPVPAPATDAASEAPASETPGAGEALIRYQVAIQAPSPLRDTLVQSVDLVRWQTYADMTEDLFDRLARQAIEQARDAANTEGYFTPTVEIDVDRATQPVSVTLRVIPGAPTRVASVTIDVTGPARDDRQYGDRTIARIRDEWLLARDDIFRQADWTNAKQRAVATLAANAYASAKLVDSKAEIDPETQHADLSVTMASGPRFQFGPFRIKGLSRYDEELVRNYSGIERGETYTLAALDQYMRRLNGAGYFASVHAAIDSETTTPEDAPVDISVIEAPPKRLEAGIGFSTDTAFRGNVSYKDVNFLGHALQFSADARLESKLQNGSLRLVQPPNAAGWSTVWSTRLERTDISGLVTQSFIAGARRISLEERNQWQYGPAFVADRQQADNGETTSAHAVYVDVERTWRRTDDLLSPTRGYMASLQVGAGIPGVSSETFARVIGRFAAWHPLGTSNELFVRAEAGAVAARTRDEVPSSLLFRTGGDTTVRGYAFESLGLRQGDATLPGRYYTVGSVEATHWFAQSWGVATFVDAGDAFDRPADARIAVGYGVGARVRTPIGPFRLDIAYGAQSRQVRLHFSVGLTF